MFTSNKIDAPKPRVINIGELRLSSVLSVPSSPRCCSSCALRQVCVALGLAENPDLVIYFRRVKRGQVLYRAGNVFRNIYAVRYGSFKTTISYNGREQVTGFQMSGELLGLDGISYEKHIYDAIALEDSELCIIPFAYLEKLCRECKSIQRNFHKIMSAEIVREGRLLLLLGNMCAEERLATFLLNFSQRLKLRGYSSYEFQLRVSREDIGNYLGMKLETVSRVFSKFQKYGFLTIQQKQVHIIDSNGLKKILADNIFSPAFPIEVM